MTPPQRDKYIVESLKYWRKALGIPDDLLIRIKYVTHRDDDEDRKYATISRDMLCYNRSTLEIYDEVFASGNFKKDADEAICHEMLHLAISPLVSYCSNMFADDVGKQRHLEEVEEQVVTALEGALTSLAGRVGG